MRYFIRRTKNIIKDKEFKFLDTFFKFQKNDHI